MKDTGKSSSRKLRRVIYYLLYRMDPQKTHYKISCSATMSKLIFSFFQITPPLTPIALRRALFVNPYGETPHFDKGGKSNGGKAHHHRNKLVKIRSQGSEAVGCKTLKHHEFARGLSNIQHNLSNNMVSQRHGGMACSWAWNLKHC